MKIQELSGKQSLTEQTLSEPAAEPSLDQAQTPDVQALSKILPGVNPTALLAALRQSRPSAQANSVLAQAFRTLVHLPARDMTRASGILVRLSRRVR